MLSSVLRSPQAAVVNIEIMRAFVRLREMIGTHADLARRLIGGRESRTSEDKLTQRLARVRCSAVGKGKSRALGPTR